MNYELIAIALGIWNIALQLRLNSKRRQAQRLMYSLDMIAHKKWKIVETAGGFDVVDHEGDKAISVSDRSKKHG
jgi:hypothetical protein